MSIFLQCCKAEQLLSAKNSIVYYQFVACFIIVHRVGACLGR